MAGFGAGLATVLANTQVVFVGVAAWVIYRERPTGLALATIPVVFGGVALISGLGRADAFGDDPLGGVAFGVVSGASYSVFLLVFRASNRELAPPAGPLLDATIGAAIGSLLSGAADPDFSFALTWPEHGWLLALAMVAQVGGWLLIAAARPGPGDLGHAVASAHGHRAVGVTDLRRRSFRPPVDRSGAGPGRGRHAHPARQRRACGRCSRRGLVRWAAARHWWRWLARL
jgi:drug/metabolite transporter (DMT)-like permease